MIGKLTGKVDSVLLDKVILDVCARVGYIVHTSKQVVSSLMIGFSWLAYRDIDSTGPYSAMWV